MPHNTIERFMETHPDRGRLDPPNVIPWWLIVETKYKSALKIRNIADPYWNKNNSPVFRPAPHGWSTNLSVRNSISGATVWLFVTAIDPQNWNLLLSLSSFIFQNEYKAICQRNYGLFPDAHRIIPQLATIVATITATVCLWLQRWLWCGPTSLIF